MSSGFKAARVLDAWQERVVDNKFRLLKRLGEGEGSVVFLAERLRGKTGSIAIKLVEADGATADAQLARWQAAASLSHPHLVRLFEMGRTALDGKSFAYVVMEHAEEDLSQVDRPLTTIEAVDMLRNTLEALRYLHGRGLVHGSLKPSNLMAVSDQLKISSDSIRPAGEWRDDLDSWHQFHPEEIVADGPSAAGDMWSLGLTLVEALTKSLPYRGTGPTAVTLPEGMPVAFQIAALNCLHRDPQRRWTVADLEEFLHRNFAQPGSGAAVSPAPIRPRRRYVLLTAGTAALALAAVVLPRFAVRRAPSPPQVDSSDRKEQVTTPLPAESALPTKAVAPEAPYRALRQGALREVLPAVPSKARNTIRGRVTVRIRVSVDGTGSVVDAQSDSPESSTFFTNLALQAARQWKFAPETPSRSGDLRQRVVRFQFVRNPERPVSAQLIPLQ